MYPKHAGEGSEMMFVSLNLMYRGALALSPRVGNKICMDLDLEENLGLDFSPYRCTITGTT